MDHRHVVTTSSGHSLSVTTAYNRVVGLVTKIVRNRIRYILAEALNDSSQPHARRHCYRWGKHASRSWRYPVSICQTTVTLGAHTHAVNCIGTQTVNGLMCSRVTCESAASLPKDKYISRMWYVMMMCCILNHFDDPTGARRFVVLPSRVPP